jgi:hypothetical protein
MGGVSLAVSSWFAAVTGRICGVGRGVLGIRARSCRHCGLVFSALIYMEPAAYKKVKKYLIAMDEKNLLGRGRLGEVRRGYQEEEKKVLVFKISGLPLSPKTQ